MAYTDKELKEATQIAYLDILEKAAKNFMADGKQGPFSIKDLIMENIDKDLIANNPNMKLQDLAMKSDIPDKEKEIISRLSDDMLDWKIADMHDTTQENGFFACVIETSEKEAIVAFRGSEGLDTYSGLVHDWVEADFALLNSKETKQQQETERYADRLLEKGVLDKYNSVSVTGHSLGGNLASHFGVISAAKERKELFDKIEQVVNFDGPGVSDEYLKYFEDQIKTASSKISHYKWSLFGNLLYGLPGEKEEFLKIDNLDKGESLLEKIKYRLYLRHHTKSIVFDENGNAERGRQDFVSKGFEVLSRTAEKIPDFVTIELGNIAAYVFDKFTYEKEDGSIGLKNPFSSVKYAGKKESFYMTCSNVLNGFLGKLKEGSNQLQAMNGRSLIKDAVKASLGEINISDIDGINNESCSRGQNEIGLSLT